MTNLTGNTDQISKAIAALKQHSSKQNDSCPSTLFCDKVLKLQISLKKLPVNSQKECIEIHLPNPYLQKQSVSICLFTKDIDKNDKRDTDKCVNFFKTLLKEEKRVDCVDQIISLKQLKIEFRTFETRRKLCSAYDIFLVDKRIATLIGPYLSRYFMESNKYPIPISLTRGNLNNQIEKSLSLSRLYYNSTTNRCCLNLGTLEQSTENLTQNFRTILDSIDKNFPGRCENIRSIDLIAPNLPQIPVYVSLGSANEVRFPAATKKSKKTVIVEDYDFGSDEDDDKEEDRIEKEPRKIKIYPDGRVSIFKDAQDFKKRNPKSKKGKLWITGRIDKKSRKGVKKNGETKNSLKREKKKSDRYYDVKNETTDSLENVVKKEEQL